MVQCVGSRNEENPNCSRICCQGAVKYALQLKELNPDMDVVILYRDMRTYGFLEDFYREARDKGVLFSRFDPDHLPQVNSDNGQLSVTFVDHVLGRPISMAVDAVVLSAGARANDTEELASLLKIPRNAGGFFIEAHAKLRPVDFASEGIFLVRHGAFPQAHRREHRPGHGRGRPGRGVSGGRQPDHQRGHRPCGAGPVRRLPGVRPDLPLRRARRSTGTTSRRSTRPYARAAAPAPRNVRPRSSRWPIMKTTRSAPRSKLYIEESDDGIV